MMGDNEHGQFPHGEVCLRSSRKTGQKRGCRLLDVSISGPKAPELGTGKGLADGVKSLAGEEVIMSEAGEGLALTVEGMPHPVGLGGRR